MRGITTPPTDIADVLDGDPVDEALVIGVLERAAVIDENEPKRVERRGYPILPDEPKTALIMTIEDDTGTSKRLGRPRRPASS